MKLNMTDIEFSSFKDVRAEEWLEILNQDALRTHLIEHPYFDENSLNEWVEDKMKVDSMAGCRVRAVYIGGVLAGWCGIQPDDNGFEIAIVISQKFWGKGISIFRILMRWASELGHREIIFHLLETRPEYKALKKMSTRSHKTTLAGHRFTTYYLAVG